MDNNNYNGQNGAPREPLPQYNPGQGYAPAGQPAPQYNPGQGYAQPAPQYNPQQGYAQPAPQFNPGQGYAQPAPQFNPGQGYAQPAPQREPLPQYAPQPDFGQPYAPPQYAQQGEQPSNPEVDSIVDSAFGKSLAATIMAWFPVCSILSIIFGSMGLKLVRAAIDRAAQLGTEPGGKNVAAKILGIIGLISGIVMTVIYTIIFITAIASCSCALASY